MCSKFGSARRGVQVLKNSTSTGRSLPLFFLLYVISIILSVGAAHQTDPFSDIKPETETILKIDKDSSTEKSDTSQGISIRFLTHDLTLAFGEEKNISYIISGSPEKNITTVEIEFNSSNSAVLNDLPSVSVKLSNHSQTKELKLKPESNGYSLVTITVLPPNMTDATEAFIRVSVPYSQSLDYVSDVVGWIYFLAWSISFYPQTWLNWRRKSVIGLHFDFLSLNIVGFLMYSIFNIGLYYIPDIKRQYFLQHPYGVNPVQLNDVIFSLHAFFACAIQVVQCIIYEKGDQRISKTGRSLLGSFTIMSIIALILGASSVILWLEFLYFLSYIKLVISLIKYIPQAYYNYLRKSTSGWSIGNVLLDFTGGLFSISQMIIISYNYNDWGSIFGDPTKFGLGIFSIMFDILFIVQHYILYKGQDYLDLREPEPIDHLSSNSFSQENVNYGSIDENNG